MPRFTLRGTHGDHLDKAPTAREQRGGYLLGEIRRVHADIYGVYGSRKLWLQLNREGFEVARCTVERLMKVDWLAGRSAERRSEPRSAIRLPSGPGTW